jgi:hypothetical protein
LFNHDGRFSQTPPPLCLNICGPGYEISCGLDSHEGTGRN